MFVKLQYADTPDSSFYINTKFIESISVFDDGSQTTITMVSGNNYDAAGDVLDVLIAKEAV